MPFYKQGRELTEREFFAIRAMPLLPEPIAFDHENHPDSRHWIAIQDHELARQCLNGIEYGGGFSA